MLYHLLYPLHDQIPLLNVFRYITFRSIYAALTALAICLIVGPYIIQWLKRYQIGQVVREDGPKKHLGKAGTPTMGGILLVLAILLATLLWADLTNVYVWLVILALVGFTGIGFLDDYLKVIRGKSEGLKARYKFGLQVAIAAGVGSVLYSLPAYSTKLSIPFFKAFTPDLGWFYIIFAVFIIVGASNAVNLTDGLDGLAIGPLMVAAVAYTIVTDATGNVKFADYLLIPFIPGAGEMAVLCAAMLGACLGFLWFNAYPASVFMGDVGSLPLGAVLGTIAVVSKHELLLVLVGGIFVIEAVSVIFQVSSYKMRGKRVFLMAPLHHHFELKGWQEPKIVVRFWIIAIILALLSLSTLKLR
ncbi:MAG: phospho-N-acetylmuramoyl-pentapeptide-transferase [Nitrospirae bacterium]|nr:phospho-N-acetylmuramoyl-pentapeptide-transferase [Nitrospirota bacterium]